MIIFFKSTICTKVNKTFSFLLHFLLCLFYLVVLHTLVVSKIVTTHEVLTTPQHSPKRHARTRYGIVRCRCCRCIECTQ